MAEALWQGVSAEIHVRHSGFDLNVDLTLPGQGVSVLFGPSGCGKTTVLRALAGLQPMQGRITVQGEVWQDAHTQLPTHRRALAYVFQEASLFPHLTVAANLAYGLRRVPASATPSMRLDDVVPLLGLSALMDRRPEALSGGERQRVAIGRALLTQPKLILMDEPLSALDAARKAELLPYLERLSRHTGVPMVYVTHALDEATRLADHLVLMDAGRVQASGPVADTLARLDLPLSHLDEASSVLQARVHSHDAPYGQSHLTVAGQGLWVGLSPVPVGQSVRVRVLARDVSVALSRAHDSSIVNVLAARIEGLREDNAQTVTLQLRLLEDSANVMADAEPQHLLARITRRSCEALRLHVGQGVLAQIKGAALMA